MVGQACERQQRTAPWLLYTSLMFVTFVVVALLSCPWWSGCHVNRATTQAISSELYLLAHVLQAESRR